MHEGQHMLKFLNEKERKKILAVTVDFYYSGFLLQWIFITVDFYCSDEREDSNSSPLLSSPAANSNIEW